ncbi:MAG: thiolase family protein [Nocardioides alkalitolerans]
MVRTLVTGSATTTFATHTDRSLGDLAGDAAAAAIASAALVAADVDAVVFGNAAEGVLRGQEMIRAQVALKGSGLEGAAMINTENACASGSAALHLGRALLLAGQADTVLVVGAEKLVHPDKQRSFDAIESGADRSLTLDTGVRGSVMMAAYAAEARAYAAEHGPVDEALARIAVKNREFAARTDFAQFRSPIDTATVRASRMVADPLRLLMCSPLTDGAAAVVLQSDSTAGERGRTAVEVLGTRVGSVRRGDSVVRATTRALYRDTQVDPADVDVLQLHDASAIAELVQYEHVGLAPAGGGRALALDGRTALGGDRPVNTDGGLMSRGHALGATGVAQVVELVRQLSGTAGPRQVPGARLGLASNSGGWMGEDYAACVATLLAAPAA